MSLLDAHRHHFAENQLSWDRRTTVHVQSEFYGLAEFKLGCSSLPPLDLELWPNVQGRSLCHLQCHFGMDSLSWARRGAQVTGLDLSPVAIQSAQALAAELGIPARFVQGNVYDAVERLGARYERVYTSYGVLGWLPELGPWAEVVASLLQPGGELLLIEFHPFIWIWDDDLRHLEHGWDSGGAVITTEQKGTYADPEANIQLRDHGWNHSIGSVVSALLGAGLLLTHLAEHQRCPYNIFPGGERRGPHDFVYPDWGHKVPYLFSLKARRPD
jgi:SAM-dependent methyltransferase